MQRYCIILSVGVFDPVKSNLQVGWLEDGYNTGRTAAYIVRYVRHLVLIKRRFFTDRQRRTRGRRHIIEGFGQRPFKNLQHAQPSLQVDSGKHRFLPS